MLKGFVMRTWSKALLVIEVLVCFGPMTLMLMTGAALVPIQIVALFSEEGRHWDGAVEVFGTVGCGLLGLWTLVFLLSKLLQGSEPQTIAKPWLVLAGAIIGALPLISPMTSHFIAWQIFGAMPIVAGLHVLFLSRRILFPPRGSSMSAP